MTFSAANGPLANCLAYLRPGDLLAVVSVDRLAPTITALLPVLSDLATRGVRVTVASLNGHQVELVTQAARPILAALAAVAAREPAGPSPEATARRLAGIAAAKAAGRFTGRRPTIRAEDVRKRLQAGTSAAVVAREMGIGRSSVYRCRQG